MFTEHSPCAGRLFAALSVGDRQCLLDEFSRNIIPVLRRRKQAQRLSNLPKTTHIVSQRASMQSHIYLTLKSALYCLSRTPTVS